MNETKSTKLTLSILAGSAFMATFASSRYPGVWVPAILTVTVLWSVLLILSRRQKPHRILLESILFFLFLCAILAPWVTPHNPTSQFGGDTFHLLGLDHLQRDHFSRLVFANRHSVGIAILGSLLACWIGSLMGALLEIGPRWFQISLETFMKVFLAVPLLVIYFLALALFQAGITTLVLILGLTLWPEPARMIQAAIGQFRSADFVHVAEMRGLGKWRIFSSEILPNLFPTIWVNFILTFINCILLESILSYLGLGLPLGTPSLGHLIQSGGIALDHHPQMLLGAMFILVIWISVLRHLSRHFKSLREHPLRIQ